MYDGWGPNEERAWVFFFYAFYTILPYISTKSWSGYYGYWCIKTFFFKKKKVDNHEFIAKAA